MSSKAYDETLDEKLGELVVAETKYSKLIVSLHRYNAGEVKLAISKMQNTQGRWSFGKLGRLTYEEFSAVAKAAKQLFAEVGR